MMARFLALLLILGFAQAQGFRAGFKLALDTPQLAGLMLRYEAEPFGIRATLGGAFGNLGYSLETHGYYRFATDGGRSGGYVGLGLGVGIGARYTCYTIPTPNPSIPSSPGVAAPSCVTDYYFSPILAGLLGYEWRIGQNLRGFLEVRPAYEFDPRYRVLPVLPLFGIGILWLF